MQKKKISPVSCFTLGLCGIFISGGAGLIMAVGGNTAHFLRVSYIAFVGAMLLFLALSENGQNQKAKRTKLMLLFLALLLSYIDLPILSPYFEAIVLPFTLYLYNNHVKRKSWLLLLVVELAFASLRTVAILPIFGTATLQIVGIALLVLNLFRFACFYQLLNSIKNIS